MGEARESEFHEFVLSQGDELLRFARLLCADWHLAEDLTQTALARCYVRWPRVSGANNPQAYARKIVLNTYLSWWRRLARQPTMETLESLPESVHVSGEAAVDDRLVMVEALNHLPRRQRAVIVMRYYADISEIETAELLGCSVGTVKSQAFKALRTLRSETAVLGETRIA